MTQKLITLLILLGLTTTNISSQNASVEKAIFGIQTGFFGIWGHSEIKLNNTIALKTELGLDQGVSIVENNIFFVPALTLSPRWYYNLNKRQKKAKRTKGNIGNFISIKTTYHPDWFIINAEELNFITDISFIPTWGIRRNIGQHFIYEAGFGLGYVHFFSKDDIFFEENNGLSFNLHLRIGYQF